VMDRLYLLHRAISRIQGERCTGPFSRSEVGSGTDQAYGMDLLIEIINRLSQNLSIHIFSVHLAYAWETALPIDSSGSVHFYYKNITVRVIFPNVRSMRSFMFRTFAP
jgi:hypothetical protein